MPAEINRYNSDFSRFVNFAMEQSKNGVTAAKSTAVTRISVSDDSDVAATSPLTGRSIKAATTDKVGVFSRKGTEKSANDTTRKAFLKSVADMFGGAEKIPPSVKTALKIGDYDKGRPLTARRIMAVKVAVDAERASWAPKSKPISLNYFDAYLGDTNLAGKTFYPSEKERINSAVPLLCSAKPLLAAGNGPAMAVHELATEGTPANRLMKYGGCFTESGRAFKEGLELLEKFDSWFDQFMSDALSDEPQSVAARNLNGSARSMECKHYFEKMIFEDLAVNPGRIKPTADETFSPEHNPVTRFFACGFSNSQNGTFLHMDPGKRAVICDAFDVLLPRLGAPNDNAVPYSPSRLVSRILLKFDDVLALHASGRLSAESLEKALYPGVDMGSGKTPVERIYNFQNNEATRMQEACIDINSPDPEVKAKAAQIQTAYVHSEETGTTLDEYCEAMSSGRDVPILADYVPYSASMAHLNGTDNGAYLQVAEDVCRASPVTDLTNDRVYETKFSFKFGTGDEMTIPTTEDTGERRRYAGAIRDKVRTMTAGRSDQATSLLYMMTQAGLMNLRSGIPSHGIGTDEHTGLKMHLTRDENTGSITINYHSVDDSPVAYHWTATVDLDGRTTTTPLMVEDRR